MPTILLADDSITIQKIVNLTFSSEGIDVVTVGNGDAAIKKIHELHPDVILADIFMPGKNGYEVCEYIKNEPELRDTPVILLVGAFEPFDSNEAERVGCNGHLTKPFEIKVLVSAVNALIPAATPETDSVELSVEEGSDDAEASSISEPESIEIETVSATESVESVVSPSLPEMPDPAVSQEPAETLEEPSAQETPEPVVSIPLGVTVEEANAVLESPEPQADAFQPPVAPPVVEIPKDLPPVPVIEDSDPLGLLAGDAQPISSDRGSFDARNLVVDIWDRAPAGQDSPALDAPESVGVPVSETNVQEPEPQSQASQPADITSKSPDEPPAVPVSIPSESPHPEDTAEESAQASPIVPNLTADLSDELIEKIANRVVEKLSRDVLERVAWEVVPDLAELMLKQHVEAQVKASES